MNQLDENKEVIPDKWILCEDERNVIYDGSGAGTFCPMPFVYDRVVYDACTRLSHDGSPGYSPFYWCPVAKYTTSNDEISNIFTESRPVGKCPQFLHPPGQKIFKEFFNTLA